MMNKTLADLINQNIATQSLNIDPVMERGRIYESEFEKWSAQARKFSYLLKLQKQVIENGEDIDNLIQFVKIFQD